MKNAPRHLQPGHPRPNVTRQLSRRRTVLQGRDEERAFRPNKELLLDGESVKGPSGECFGATSRATFRFSGLPDAIKGFEATGPLAKNIRGHQAGKLSDLAAILPPPLDFARPLLPFPHPVIARAIPGIGDLVIFPRKAMIHLMTRTMPLSFIAKMVYYRDGLESRVFR